MGENLKKTPLWEEHAKLGAKLIPFAGFDMPVQYPAGVTNEHKAVRESAGLFDVSHMGEFSVRGQHAAAFVDWVIANDASRLVPGQALYSVMCRDDGGIVDDLLVYRFQDWFRLVVNAANIEKDFDWLQSLRAQRGDEDVVLKDESDNVALLALQGPKSEEILRPLTDVDVEGIAYYHFQEGRVSDEPCVVSRTGYTGEDGFEIYSEPRSASKLWNAILADGERRVSPVGLGARDTLRLEMGYALYGNDIDEETNPLEAGLAWTVKLEKGDFVGRAALRTQKERGLARKLAGFVLQERGFPRPGYEIRCDGEAAGTVRSGTVGPSVGVGIGTGYLPVPFAKPGSKIEVAVRGKTLAAEVTRTPFYQGGSIKR